MKTYNFIDGRSNRMWGGVIILVIGLLFLLNNFDIDLPNWLFSWSTILLAAGVIIGAKRNFIAGRWILMVVIGAYFTLSSILGISSSEYFFPFIFIASGLYLILKQPFYTKLNIK